MKSSRSPYISQIGMAIFMYGPIAFVLVHVHKIILQGPDWIEEVSLLGFIYL